MASIQASARNSAESQKKTPSTGGLFPMKVHKMIQDAKIEGNQDIISWLPSGKAFKIHDRSRFIRTILPRYFGASKFRSFQRNFNLWNMEVETKSPNKGNVSHPYFLRDHPNLCLKMRREKVKNQADKTAEVSEAPSSNGNLFATSGIVNWTSDPLLALSLSPPTLPSSVWLLSANPISIPSTSPNGSSHPNCSEEGNHVSQAVTTNMSSNPFLLALQHNILRSQLRQKEENEALRSILARRDTVAKLELLSILDGALEQGLH